MFKLRQLLIGAGTRVVDFEQLSDLTTSGAARDESTTGGKLPHVNPVLV